MKGVRDDVPTPYVRRAAYLVIRPGERKKAFSAYCLFLSHYWPVLFFLLSRFWARQRGTCAAYIQHGAYRRMRTSCVFVHVHTPYFIQIIPWTPALPTSTDGGVRMGHDGYEVILSTRSTCTLGSARDSRQERASDVFTPADRVWG